jgi:hypothetical protein
MCGGVTKMEMRKMILLIGINLVAFVLVIGFLTRYEGCKDNKRPSQYLRWFVGILKIYVLIVLIGGVYFYYFILGQFDAKWAIEHQLKQIIETQDKDRISSLSADGPTKEYLLHLSKNIDVHDTTDFQGGSEEIGYYVTTVGSDPLNVWLKKDSESTWNKIFPKWTLFKVSIAPDRKLPSFHLF